ncbi:MAG: hypothetical protein WBK88_09210 [Methanothrix sp.]
MAGGKPPKGGHKVTLKMDVPREVRWTIRAKAQFEGLVRDYLIDHKMIEEGTQVVAWNIMIGGIAGDAQVLLHAVECSLGISGEELDRALDAYEGSTLELAREITRALCIAEDPSRESSLLKSWSIFDERQEAERLLTEKKDQARLDEVQQKILAQDRVLAASKSLREKATEAELAKIGRRIAQLDRLINPPPVPTPETTEDETRPTPTLTTDTATSID